MLTINLRSDTVTKPTPGMRAAIANAEVGDDMNGEDPTVNRLEALCAKLFGKEAAVFACSGTQSNQMAIRTHCRPGDELLCHETSHVACYEAGGPAALSGVSTRAIPGAGGMIDLPELRGKVRSDDQHLAQTRLVCIENTTNAGGGHAYPLDQLNRIGEWARSVGLKVHIDGARAFNATVARGYSPAEMAACADTVSICFSKGLGCPMGSILVGSKTDIAAARRARKLFGGALRQAGIVAAAAIYALEHHVERMADDHRNAKRLAEIVSKIDGLTARPEEVDTNIFFFEVNPKLGFASQLSAALQQKGLLIYDSGPQRLRVVTHLDFSAEWIDEVGERIRQAMREGFGHFPGTALGHYARG